MGTISKTPSSLSIGESLAKLPEALTRVARPGSKVMIVADAAVAGRHGKTLVSGLKAEDFDARMTVIRGGEHSKTLSKAEMIYRELARAKFERNSWLIALGGGVVGDLTGFVAATYLRGIPYVQVPTTLLAQVDASIGGKTGVDIPEGKNLVGAFYHPQLVWIDPALLESLPERHWRNGLAEVIKYGAILDASLFELLESKMDQLLKGYGPEWNAVIDRCARLKADIVKKDPKEIIGQRAILNFGHSVGHAIEAASQYRTYLHGEAISIGMFVAAILSEQMTDLNGLDRIRLGALLTKAGLPARVKKPIPRSRLLQFLARDKKALDGKVRFVLLKNLGEAVPAQQVSPELLSQALSASGL